MQTFAKSCSFQQYFFNKTQMRECHCHYDLYVVMSLRFFTEDDNSTSLPSFAIFTPITTKSSQSPHSTFYMPTFVKIEAVEVC